MTTFTGDEPIELNYDEAVALLPDSDYIHTVLNPGRFLIGADWSRESILALLQRSPRREVTGPQAQSMSHGLCAYDDDGRPVFIETRQPAPAAGCDSAGNRESP